MKEVGVGFQPKRSKLGLYLHGPPGVGKSEFVKIFSKVFGTLLQKYYHPTIQVRFPSLEYQLQYNELGHSERNTHVFLC